ncbi:MAG: hypothetical protein ABUL64_02275 [Singulisphaera sp.]
MISATHDAMEELETLLHQLCDSRLDSEGYARLSQLMAESEAARKRYLEHIDLCVGIAYEMPRADDRNPVFSSLHGAGVVLLGDLLNAETHPFDSTSIFCLNGDGAASGRPSLVGPWLRALESCGRALSRSRWFRPAAAALAIFLALGITWTMHSLQPLDGQLPPAPQEIPADPGSDFAARIVGMTNDATWGDPQVKFDALFRLAAEETIHVATGLVKVEFYSGAVVILSGPAVFTPTGPDSGRLDQGRLTGKAANGNFRLTTHAAEVIDLGTEFGVAVDDVSGTDVLVFDGKVQVVSLAAGHKAGDVLTMTDGMAARIHLDGTTEHDFQTDPDAFSRSLAHPLRDDSDELSLVDIICGGNGSDNNLAGAINPLTGSPDSGIWQHHFGAGRRYGDGTFHPTSHRPPLDGVFVPPMDGKNVQIDSLGNRVDLPPNLGQTFGPIWALRWTEMLDSAENTVDFWGTGTLVNVNSRLKTSRNGVIGLHANAGFTIDLQAARLQQHRGINAFSCRVANLDSSEEWLKGVFDPALNTADFRVFVDGELRYSRLGFRRADGDIDVFVPLTAADQRLTLLITEGEGTIRFDNVVLIDPILKRDQPKRKPSSL